MQPDEDLNRSKPVQKKGVLIFKFSILVLIFIDEFLAVVFGTKPGFVSMVVSCLYLDDPLLDYFRKQISCIFFSNYNGN